MTSAAIYGYVASVSANSYDIEFIDSTGNAKVDNIVVDLPTLLKFQQGEYSPAVSDALDAKWPGGFSAVWVSDADNDDRVITARANYADVAIAPDPTVAMVEQIAANDAARRQAAGDLIHDSETMDEPVMNDVPPYENSGTVYPGNL